jgi:hypothetical protein
MFYIITIISIMGLVSAACGCGTGIECMKCHEATWYWPKYCEKCVSGSGEPCGLGGGSLIKYSKSGLECDGGTGKCAHVPRKENEGCSI